MIVVLGAFSLLLIESAKAQSNVVATNCAISVDDVVEGQPVAVAIQMSPSAPTEEGYKVLMWITSPNGTGDKELNGDWIKSALTESVGRATVAFNVPTYGGKWYVDVSFGGNGYSDPTTLYSAGHWQSQFTVYPAKTPNPTITATPSVTVAPTVSPLPSPIVSELPITTVLVAVIAAAGIF